MNLVQYARKYGISYSLFLKQEMEDRIALQKAGTIIDEFDHYIELNYRRSLRVSKQFQLSDEKRSVLQSFRLPMIWLVLTEAWCGDSAQSLPVIAAIADSSPFIELRILLRDQHPEVMDQFLTNGTRGIPKLVAVHEQGEVLFTWGPRPEPAVVLFRREKEKGTPKEEIYVKLHTWYARDKGQTIAEEIFQLIVSLIHSSFGESIG